MQLARQEREMRVVWEVPEYGCEVQKTIARCDIEENVKIVPY